MNHTWSTICVSIISQTSDSSRYGFTPAYSPVDNVTTSRATSASKYENMWGRKLLVTSGSPVRRNFLIICRSCN